MRRSGRSRSKTFTDRFKAIASMMGLYDPKSFYGGTEELWFPEWDLKGQPWNSSQYEKHGSSRVVPQVSWRRPTSVDDRAILAQSGIRSRERKAAGGGARRGH